MVKPSKTVFFIIAKTNSKINPARYAVYRLL
jgi:hypothetical protein